VGLAEDLSKGVVDRFRSLPMSGVAVLAGRTVSDTLRNIASISLVIALGYLIGFRFEAGVPAALVAISTAAALGFAVSWMVALIATIVRSAEAVGMVNMLWLLPVWFASSMFVPTNTMPGWLEPIAHNQPVSVAVDAIRALSTSGFDTALVLKALLWSAVLLLVFVPLATFRYRRSV
jgi:ABC-2 type transport system permease protein/oleandomycin transport system permease protein